MHRRDFYVKIEKIDKDCRRLTVRTSETNEEKWLFVSPTSTMIGYSDGNRYYADTDVLEGLRDGIEIGASYARKLMIESFRPMRPFFKGADDLELMNRVCEKEKI